MLDHDTLMAPFADGSPCGPDLRGDPEFRDIEDAPGDFATLKSPELLQVVARCDAFLQRTRDHAPALVALQAAVRTGNLMLANAALRLVKDYAEVYWDDFHPGPADEMAMARINEISALARPAAMTLPLQRIAIAAMPAPSQQGFTAAMIALACDPVAEWSSADEEALATQVEAGQMSATQARAVRPNREGARTLRLIMRVLSADARAADAEADVGGEDLDLPADMVRGLAVGLVGQVADAGLQLQQMSDLLYDLNAVYDARAGDSASLGSVFSLLKAIIGDLDRFVATFPAEEAAMAFDDAAAVAPADGVAGGAPAVATPRGFVVTTPQSRADVLQAIDAIARFYTEREPTSPVPLMLNRVRSWIGMNFIELMREIAPDGLHEAEKLLASPSE